MTYSKTHQKFSKRLNKPEALTHPANYLGPNYKDVLNFWIYLDTLSDEEKEEMDQRYDNVRDTAWNVADEVVGWQFSYAASFAACGVTGGRVVFGWATWELIGHNKLLEQNQTPLALQCCIKP
jgi:hypothetical protein